MAIRCCGIVVQQIGNDMIDGYFIYLCIVFAPDYFHFQISNDIGLLNEIPKNLAHNLSGKKAHNLSFRIQLINFSENLEIYT
jgi:hypothetical protein